MAATRDGRWHRGLAADSGTYNGRRAVIVSPLLVLPQGFLELVFEDDDAAGGLEGGALVDEFPGAGGQAQLVAGVAAVSAGGALRGDQFRFVEAAQEALGGAEHLGGPAHGVGGVVLVVEHVLGVLAHSTSMSRAPAPKRRGPGLRVRTPSPAYRRLVVSAPAARGGLGCEDRISVTETTFRSMETAVSARAGCGRRRAIQRGCTGPPFPLLPSRTLLSARAARSLS